MQTHPQAQEPKSIPVLGSVLTSRQAQAGKKQRLPDEDFLRFAQDKLTSTLCARCKLIWDFEETPVSSDAASP